MPFQGHAFGGIEPFLWVGAGIGGRWLYGVLFDAPPADAGTLIVTGTLIGTGCYALTLVIPLALGALAGGKKSDGD
jgi:hypothetical protein